MKQKIKGRETSGLYFLLRVICFILFGFSGNFSMRQNKEDTQHVFIIGAKSLGAYGGYETFVNKLTEYHQNVTELKYHVACKANGDGSMDEGRLEGVSDIVKDAKGNTAEFTYHSARCFKIQIPGIGPAQAIYYDVKALEKCVEYIKDNGIYNPIIYILACRIGPFIKKYCKIIHRLGGRVFVNPDGHEWKRAKWSAPVRRYWKMSERLMIKYCDLVICDSVNIERYVHESYDGKGIKGASPKTTYIAYGAESRKSKLSDEDPKLLNWYKSRELKPKDYYLVVGRFVPENNYETMIKEFMRSRSKKALVIVTNVNGKFLDKLEKKLHFLDDKRIKFVGTVYNQELLMKIRENAYAYLHGHEVGGTNPSLLEALGSTDLNLLLDVGFNREVAKDCAKYWSKERNSLAGLIDSADMMDTDEISRYGLKARERIKSAYSWGKICDKYRKIFTSGEKDYVNSLIMEGCKEAENIG